MKFTRFFEEMRSRPDRASRLMEWIYRAVENPDAEMVREDGRIRRWAQIQEAAGRYLRVILLGDSEAVHNAFFDRKFRP